MSKREETASFHLTLFAVYKRVDKHPEPTFLYTNREGESRNLPFLQPEEDNRKAVKSALHRLQPLARRIFSADRHVFYSLPKELADALGQVWHLGNDELPLRFTGAGGVRMEEDYLLLYLEVQPHLPVMNTKALAETSVRLCNRLSYAGQLHGPAKKVNIPKNSLLTRSFRDEKDEQVAQRHFQGNSSKETLEQPLIKGLLGETLALEDMFATIAGPGWESMLGDRFLLNSLLVTPTDEEVPECNSREQDDLIRRARGMSWSYHPPATEDLAGHVIPVRTFRNILFMAANEGVAGHVKPAPGQDFLCHQFSARYRTEYMLLFILAVYQHYRLAAMLYTCVQGIEEQGGKGDKGEGGDMEYLRWLRKELVLHELQYINTQPAFLTNYQQYYCGLRQGLHTEALVVKLRHTLTELDILLAAEEQRREEREQHAKKAQKRRDENAKMLLAMIAEAFALPYYLYSFLVHAFHLKEDGWCIWVALAFTGLVTWTVVNNTWRMMRGKEPWSAVQRLFQRES
ncbi:MAG: hypothetical protein SD837_08955 [Candidatus Electrothrix scaldis]|nr:MAG: hypothetical protein SD837_08955 [Candidatus Electrothrix sp. GW3-3]